MTHLAPSRMALLLFTLTPLLAGSPLASQDHPKAPYLLGTFVGKLPCADCSGITIRLSLYLTAPNNFTAPTYVQRLTYEGKPAKPYVQRGNWSILKGAKGKPQATVYQLDPEHPDRATSYLRIDQTTLQQLDRDGNPIISPFPYILHRVADAARSTRNSEAPHSRITGRTRCASYCSAFFQNPAPWFANRTSTVLIS